MRPQEIPPQVFADLTTGRDVQVHDIHDYVSRLGSRERNLYLQNDGTEVRTCEVGPNLWLRLTGTRQNDTILEAVRGLRVGLDHPIDHPHVTDAQNFPNYASLARLSSGDWPAGHDHARRTLFMRYSLGDLNFLHRFDAETVLAATNLVNEMARRAFTLFGATRQPELQTPEPQG